MPHQSRVSALFSVNVAAGAVLLAVLAGAVTRAAASELPEGQGREQVLQICTQCHSAEQIVSRHRTEQEWTDVITRMTTEGAVVTDVQFQSILTYLAAKFGKPDAIPVSPTLPRQ